GEIHPDGAHALRPTASHLGDAVFKPLRQLDARVVLGAGDRIADRFAPALDHVRNHQPGSAALDVDLELDLGEDGIVDFREGRGKDLPDGCTRLGILPGENAQQGLALSRRGLLMDDQLHLTVAFVDCSGPGRYPRYLEAVKPGAAVIPFIDGIAEDRFAVAVGRPGIELAGAAIRTVAIGEISRLDHPVDHGCPRRLGYAPARVRLSAIRAWIRAGEARIPHFKSSRQLHTRA